jgi:hypothetical protein
MKQILLLVSVVILVILILVLKQKSLQKALVDLNPFEQNTKPVNYEKPSPGSCNRLQLAVDPRHPQAEFEVYNGAGGEVNDLAYSQQAPYLNKQNIRMRSDPSKLQMMCSRK